MMLNIYASEIIHWLAEMANTGAYVACQSETIYEISVPWEIW